MTKRSDFPDILPTVHTKYCFVCGVPSVEKNTVESTDGPHTRFTCTTCHETSDRVRIWDPGMIQYFDEAENLVHEGAGTIVQNERGEVLLFMRTKYPFLWTIPGGHMSPGEDPKVAALRELAEETGITVTDAVPLFTGTVTGDECMGGADIHIWHLYLVTTNAATITLDGEGSSYGWFPASAIPKECTFPVLYLFNQPSVQKALTI